MVNCTLSSRSEFSQIMVNKSGSAVFGIRQDELRQVYILIPNIKI